MNTQSLFGDKRLDREYRALVSDMFSSGTSVINRACKTASRKKAAYRFINNSRVLVESIADDLVNQVVDNIESLQVKDVLVAQDTMEVVRDHLIDRLSKRGEPILECSQTHKGMRMHSAVVMKSSDGIPMGIGYLKIWGREPRPIADVKPEDITEDRKRQPAYYMTDPETGKKRYKYFVPVYERESESNRWLEAAKDLRREIPEDVHITMVQDREGDMYPLLTLPYELENLDIIVRATKRRKVILNDGAVKDMFDYTRNVPVVDSYEISVGKGPRKKARKAQVELRYGKIKIRCPHSPVYPRKSVDLWFVRVTEKSPQKGSGIEPVDWLLLTSIEVDSLEKAKKIVGFYRNRWFIEDMHRLLKKKGFGIEEIQVESPHAFEINLAVAIKTAYEVALLKKGFDSGDESVPASIALTPLEMQIVTNLNRIFNPEKKVHKNPYAKGSLAWAAWAVACEGGWSAMPSQPKPGLITFKRGMDKIENIYEYLLEEATLT